ncbi:MAG TPA: HAD family hydrolase [Gemmatimonadaceae bacterium]|nr:HAD family hydrolase [Gemmatimonadaceae bacterium]
MMSKTKPYLLVLALASALALAAAGAQASDPLPSWNDGPAKRSIVTFVEKVTTPGSPDFVPVPKRIATFDNDGTLWCEKPMPVQLYFALDRVKALAPQHPEWKTQEPFASVLRGDLKTAAAGGDRAILDLMMATHTGNTTEEFERIVKDWIATARHPKTGKLYTEMVYQPMLEVLAYLRANGFKTFIVSGGGIEFMRPWAERVYGIPPEQVIGSSVKTQFEIRDGQPVLVRLPDLSFNDDKAGKPVAINQHVGRRPVMAFGNSDGDLQMLQWTAAGPGARFCLYVHHDDAGREYAYDRQDALAKLDHGLDEAAAKGWTVVSMKSDWRQVFPFEVTAIDILLEPDAAMLERCKADNARLLGDYPKGFALDATHTPHITMLQCFVRTADLDKLYAAEERVLAAANIGAMRLDAFKRYYIPAGGGLGVAGICAKPTPQILKLQADIIAAASPFNLRSGPIGAFTTGHDDPDTDAALIQYVSTFEHIGSGEHFNPHVSTGAAPKEVLDKMIAEPFESFAFSPAGAAVYQLGPLGTAAKKLKEWDLRH